jgi:2-polyprenyl-3-methyl-5-hydroxy-6-metoxy-1,4-benzoquinol methylase
MNCNICENKAEFLFKATVLLKYNVAYFKCTNCGFIRTENPYWLKEAYSDAISSLDIGLVERNFNLTQIAAPIIKCYFNYKSKFLDYAGGYGLFVRLMRDRGFDFYRQDIYCDNILARNFDITDLNSPSRFEMLTAFEVFEHLHDPLQESITNV